MLLRYGFAGPQQSMVEGEQLANRLVALAQSQRWNPTGAAEGQEPISGVPDQVGALIELFREAECHRGDRRTVEAGGGVLASYLVPCSRLLHLPPRKAVPILEAIKDVEPPEERAGIIAAVLARPLEPAENELAALTMLRDHHAAALGRDKAWRKARPFLGSEGTPDTGSSTPPLSGGEGTLAGRKALLAVRSREAEYHVKMLAAIEAWIATPPPPPPLLVEEAVEDEESDENEEGEEEEAASIEGKKKPPHTEL